MLNMKLVLVVIMCCLLVTRIANSSTSLEVVDTSNKPSIKAVVVCWKRKYHTLKNWFRTALFTSCKVEYLCFQELEKADARNDEPFVRKYLTPGTFFVGMAEASEPQSSGIGEILPRMCAKYNVSMKSLYFGHTGDESRPPFPYLKDFYLQFKKVYRNYWWNVEPFLSLRAQGVLEWMPMGPLTRGVVPFKLIPSSQRQRPLYFSGGRITNTRRPGQVAFLGKLLNATISGSFKGSKTYIDDLRNSQFCINIRGTSAECFRFYESLEAGCIPILLDEFHDFNYGEQHEHQYSLLLEVAWNKTGIPILWAKTQAELIATYNGYVRSGDEGLRRLDMLQADMMLWYDKMLAHYDKKMSTDMCIVRPAVA